MSTATRFFGNEGQFVGWMQGEFDIGTLRWEKQKRMPGQPSPGPDRPAAPTSDPLAPLRNPTPEPVPEDVPVARVPGSVSGRDLRCARVRWWRCPRSSIECGCRPRVNQS